VNAALLSAISGRTPGGTSFPRFGFHRLRLGLELPRTLAAT
jgi:hypothetical protein